jgi:hypothetical protein
MQSSIWTLTHITFDAETNEWRLKGECFGPPIDEPARVYGIGATFADALADWERMARHHQQVRSQARAERSGSGP